MTATDELRRMLDERGVEWEQSPQDGWYRTEWTGRYGKCNAMEWKPALTVMMPNLTPEQAIAATLGSDAKPCYATDHTHARCKYSVNRGWTEDTKFYVPTLRMLTAEQVREAIMENAWEETGTLFEFGDSSWQAIADELNATLGGGECERITTRNGKFKTKYGRKVPLCEYCGYAIGDDRYNFCPKCGAKIVEAVKR